MKNFADPAANAKTIGLFYLVLGVLILLSAILQPIALIFGAGYLLAGWGMRKLQVWSIYLLLMVATIGLLHDIYSVTQGIQAPIFSLSVNTSSLVLAAGFYSVKHKFISS